MKDLQPLPVIFGSALHGARNRSFLPERDRDSVKPVIGDLWRRAQIQRGSRSAIAVGLLCYGEGAMAKEVIEDHYTIKPDAFGRFEVHVSHGGVGMTRPRGRFNTAEAAQAWIDRRKRRDTPRAPEAAMKAPMHAKQAVRI